MKIEFSVRDADIENGIAKWAAHRTGQAIDNYLNSNHFIRLIEQMVKEQVEPMMSQISIEVPVESVQKYADRHANTCMQNEVRRAFRKARGTLRKSADESVISAIPTQVEV